MMKEQDLRIEIEDLMDKEVQLGVNVFRMIFERDAILNRLAILEQQILDAQQELNEAKEKRKWNVSYINKYCRPILSRLGEKKDD